MPSSLVKLFGTEEQPAETRLLTAGPLSVELDAGNLRYIRYQGHEALRAIAYVVRDDVWGTYGVRIEDFDVEERADGFTVTYTGVCAGDGQEFSYRARITGKADGTLVFEGTGGPATDFVTNRTGFVVLHPVAGVAGEPVEVLHVNGETEHTEFPEVIDPDCPMRDIRALTHQVSPGLRVTCTMEGDTFEMEDQRNWTDASYKTYVRPLSLPMPYTLKKGEEFEQAVRVTFEGEPSISGGGGDEAVHVTIQDTTGAAPAFGMALDPQSALSALQHEDAMCELAPAFFSGLVDLRANHPDLLQHYRTLSEKHGASIGLEIVVRGEDDPDEQLAMLASNAKAAGLEPESVAVTRSEHLLFVPPGSVFPNSQDFDVIYAAARRQFPDARLGGGNFVYFTEFNRKPPPFEQLDFICHGTCAIVHAADDRSVTETIECLPSVVGSGRALFGNRHYRVGPASIATHFAPFGGNPTSNPDNVRVTMTDTDPRQRSLLGAAWHLGYGARMAETGVDSVILGAPTGPFGLIHHDRGQQVPGYDTSGTLYPAYHVMRGLYRLSGAPHVATSSSDPRNVQSFAVQGETGLEVWLANLSGENCRVDLSGNVPGSGRVSAVDETTFETLMSSPRALDAGRPMSGTAITLASYAVARIRFDQ